MQSVKGVGAVVGGGWHRGMGVWGGGGGLMVGGTEILEIWLIQWLIHMVKISSKSEVFQFSGGQNPQLRGLQ